MAQKLHWQIKIYAPAKKVWDFMLGKETYKQWTGVFAPDADSPPNGFEGSWEKGSEIKFVDSSGDGMLGTIIENRPYEFVCIKYYGMIIGGKKVTSEGEAAKWGDALESYTFKEENGATTLLVDMDSDEQYADMFNDMWPKALLKLKELVEKS